MAAAASGVVVHHLPGGFTPAGLRGLGRRLGRFHRPRRLLVQYVPHGYGMKAMNVPFALWLWWRRWRHGDDVRVMFHEVAYPWVRRPLRHNLIAAVSRLSAAILVKASRRIYVSIPAWKAMLRGVGDRPVTILPIPATVPAATDDAAVARCQQELLTARPGTRLVVGHFGTYGERIGVPLAQTLTTLLDCRPDVAVLLIGKNGEGFRERLPVGHHGRVVASGPLAADDVAVHLRCCDLAVQPYADGASGRRTSLMASLINGVAVATTAGFLSEPYWRDGSVPVVPAGDPQALAQLCLDLLNDPARRTAAGRGGRRLYEDRFAIGHTLAVLAEG